MVQLIINISHTFALLLLISYSFKIIYNVVGLIHVVHAIIISAGSYFIFFFSIQMHIAPFVGFLLTVSCCIVLSLLVEKSIYQPLRKIEVENWQILLASLGLYVVLQNIISIIWGDRSLSFRTWPVAKGNEILGAYITNVQIATIIASIVLIISAWLLIEKTKTGKEIKAISDNKELGGMFGISANRIIIWSFALGSVLAACAGILIAADTDMTPTMGFDWLLYGVVAMIIGGVGKMRYLILGAMLLASAQHLTAYYIGSKWMDATAFIILIIFLAWKPYGFSGQKLRKAEI